MLTASPYSRYKQVHSPFLLATGVENSYPKLRNGARIDQMEKCGHYTRWQEDFELVKAMGLDALRYGPAWYRVHDQPHHFEWDPVDGKMERLRNLGVEVIADLCHFGTPDWLGSFQSDELPIALASYAGAFARRYPWIRYYTPVNEIFVCASFSALYGWWNECESSDAAFVRAMRNMCRAHELAIEEILRVRPDAIFIQSESVEHFHPAGAAAAGEADRMNDVKFLALDLTLGRPLGERMVTYLLRHGMTADDLAFFSTTRARNQRWIGLDYYATCEHRIASTGRRTASQARRGLRALATEYYGRYNLPLFHCETNKTAAAAERWLIEQWNDVRALVAAGLPTHGFTWYSLTDQIDWQHALRVERNDIHPVGLFDLERRIRPVGTAYRELVARFRADAAPSA